MDYFGKDGSILKQKKLFLFDMDGTIYNEELLFDGTLELINKILNDNNKVVFITNNSSKSVNSYIEKLNKFGIKTSKDNFFTSTMATIIFLKEKYDNAKIYVQGTRSFINELRENGVKFVTNYEPGITTAVVGFDTELTSDKLRKTCEVLSKGNVDFIATNPDLACPVSFGFIPDCGSICNMITNATGKVPIYIGKPEPTMIYLALEKFNCSKDETVVIGDRLYTDIASGINAGVTTICVLTGEAKINDIINGRIKPTFCYRSVKEIYDEIKK